MTFFCFWAISSLDFSNISFMRVGTYLLLSFLAPIFFVKAWTVAASSLRFCVLIFGLGGLAVKLLQAHLIAVVVIVEELILVVVLKGNERLLDHLEVDEADPIEVVLVNAERQDLER